MTAEEVKELLKDYYDIPQKIAEEFATIWNCETEKNKITLPSVNLSGLPGRASAFRMTPGRNTDHGVVFDPEEQKLKGKSGNAGRANQPDEETRLR